MPKVYSLEEKNQWLTLSDQGKTEDEIKKSSEDWNNLDNRTLRNGIAEARAVQERGYVKQQMLLNAFEKHNEDLRNVLTNIGKVVVVPPHDLKITWGNDIWKHPVILSGGAVMIVNLDGNPTMSIEAESGLIGQMLREHIKHDSLWAALRMWKSATVKHLYARKMLMQTLETAIIQEAGLADSITEIDGQSPELVVKLRGRYQSWMQEIMGRTDTIFRKDEVYPTPDSSEQAIEQIDASHECTDVLDTLIELQVITNKVQKKIEEWSFVGLIPGECRICKKLWK